MKHILLTTALAAVLALPAGAQTDDTTAPDSAPETLVPAPEDTAPEDTAPEDSASPLEATDDEAGDEAADAAGSGDTFLTDPGGPTISSSTLIGKTVYVSEHGGHPDVVDGVPADWSRVANVGDLLISREGQVEAVLIDIGGFLGIGSRTVAVDMDALAFVRESERDDFHVVFTATREQLENAPEYRPAPPPAPVDGMMDGDAMGGAMGGAMGQAPDDEAMPGADPEAEAVETFEPADPNAISVDDLRGARVYGPDDASVASISDVLLSETGAIDRVIVDVGGFLGIGAKPVAIDFADLDLREDPERGSLRVHVGMSREQLEALPDYEG